jgi:hypothetical protein
MSFGMLSLELPAIAPCSKTSVEIVEPVTIDPEYSFQEDEFKLDFEFVELITPFIHGIKVI